MKKIINNKVTLNLIKLCDILSTRDVFNHYKLYNSGKSEDEIEYMIYVEDEKNTFIFRKEAQDMYNDYYDEYWTIIENLAL